MELSALSNVDLINAFKVPQISSSMDDSSTGTVQGNGAFKALFDSAANMISDANDYSNAAEVEEMKYSMGETENHNHFGHMCGTGIDRCDGVSCLTSYMDKVSAIQ